MQWLDRQIVGFVVAVIVLIRSTSRSPSDEMSIAMRIRATQTNVYQFIMFELIGLICPVDGMHRYQKHIIPNAE